MFFNVEYEYAERSSPTTKDKSKVRSISIMTESLLEAKARPIVVGQNHWGSIEHGGCAGCVPIEIPLQEIHDHYPVFPKLFSKRGANQVVTMKAPSS